MEKDIVNTAVDENQNEDNDQEDSPTPKSKKKFGLFRLSGRKSKDSKHGSSDSLKRQSRDSADFGSEFSLEESTRSLELSAAEKAEVTNKVVLDPEGSSEGTKLQSDAKASNETKLEEAVLKGSSSESKNTSAVQPELAEPEGIDKTGAEEMNGEDISAKQDIVDVKLQKEILEKSVEEPASIQEQNKSAENSQEKQSSVIAKEPSVGVDDISSNTKEEQKESVVTMTIEETVSSYAEETSHVESRRSFEVALEDIKTVHDREITSSEDESVDTVVSTGIPNTGDIAETNEEAQVVTRNKSDMEEPIIAIFNERKGPQKGNLQEQREQDETPVNEEAILLMYPHKLEIQEQNQRHDDHAGEEEAVVLTVDENKENQLQEQVNELLKLDANIKESRPKQESESHVVSVKTVREEMVSTTETNEVKESRKGIDIIDDRPLKLKSAESSPFNEKTSFTSSTPKRPSIDNKKATRKEAKHEELKEPKPVEVNMVDAGFKKSSKMEFQLRIQFSNTIKEVKMSSTELLAQLAEINKQLRELRRELLKVLEIGKDEPKKTDTHEVSVQL